MTTSGLPSWLHCLPTLRASPSPHVIQRFLQHLSKSSSSKPNIFGASTGKQRYPNSCLSSSQVQPTRFHATYQRGQFFLKDPRGSKRTIHSSQARHLFLSNDGLRSPRRVNPCLCRGSVSKSRFLHRQKEGFV